MREFSRWYLNAYRGQSTPLLDVYPVDQQEQVDGLFHRGIWSICIFPLKDTNCTLLPVFWDRQFLETSLAAGLLIRQGISGSSSSVYFWPSRCLCFCLSAYCRYPCYWCFYAEPGIRNLQACKLWFCSIFKAWQCGSFLFPLNRMALNLGFFYRVLHWEDFWPPFPIRFYSIAMPLQPLVPVCCSSCISETWKVIKVKESWWPGKPGCGPVTLPWSSLTAFQLALRRVCHLFLRLLSTLPLYYQNGLYSFPETEIGIIMAFSGLSGFFFLRCCWSILQSGILQPVQRS